jgi:hypothetical protein
MRLIAIHGEHSSGDGGEIDPEPTASASSSRALDMMGTFTVSRTRDAWRALSDDPAYLAQLERNLEGLRKAGFAEQ